MTDFVLKCVLKRLYFLLEYFSLVLIKLSDILTTRELPVHEVKRLLRKIDKDIFVDLIFMFAEKTLTTDELCSKGAMILVK